MPAVRCSLPDTWLENGSWVLPGLLPALQCKPSNAGGSDNVPLLLLLIFLVCLGSRQNWKIWKLVKKKGKKNPAWTIYVAQPEAGSFALESPLLLPWLLLTRKCRRHNSTAGNRERPVPQPAETHSALSARQQHGAPWPPLLLSGCGAAATASVEMSLGQPPPGAMSQCPSCYRHASLAGAMGYTNERAWLSIWFSF